MKRNLLVVLLLTATIFAQPPDIILDGFSWPEQVRSEMSIRLSSTSTEVVLSQKQLAYEGYSLVD